MLTKHKNFRGMVSRGGVRKLLSVVAGALCAQLLAAPAHALDAAQIYALRAPSIWVVHVFDAQARRIGQGSAVVIGPDKLVTNCHVLFHGKSIAVKRENTSHGARLEYADVDRDLCILRAKDLAAPAVPVAPLASLKVGDRVYALGAPRGLELTLSDGLLAALHHDRDDNIVRLQMTAPISPGSSGGGLFDSEGRLVGVSYMTIRDAQNLNFAIPAAWIDQVPARATAALQKFRAEQATATVAAAPKPANVPPLSGPEMTVVSGDDLSRHVASLGRIMVTAPSGVQLEMRFSPNGSFGVTNMRSGGYSNGQLTVAPNSNEVCLAVGNPRFSAMQTCYRVTRNGETYTMRSVSSSYYFTYAFQGS